MAGNGRKNGAADGVIDRALNVGFAQAAKGGGEVEVELRLDAGQERMVLELCSVFGLSVRTLLNAALRYALYLAEARGAHPTRLREFPKRQVGQVVKFVVAPEALTKLREGGLLDNLAGCAVAGVKLLHAKTLKTRRAR